MPDLDAGRWIYLIALLAFSLMRMPYELRASRDKVVDRRIGLRESLSIAVLGIGWAGLPLLYVFTGWLDAADYRLPRSLQGSGLALGTVGLALSLALLWRSMADLGTNWSKSLEIREHHELVTSGIYARTRHPMYLALWVWGLAQPLLLHNGLVAAGGLLAAAALWFGRIGPEEAMMREHFGDAYTAYTDRVGRVWTSG